MRRSVTLVVIVFLTSVVAGCRTPPRKDLVEAELRVKDQDLRELRSDLERTEAYNQFLQRELRNLQQFSPTTGVSEGVSSTRLKAIQLGRQTGGIDEDNLPGDEALQVVIEPRDGDNHVIKALGTAQIQALEVSPEGIKKPLATWQISEETLRKGWRTGLLSTGYYLTLPWKNWPSSTKVRVIVQFVSQDQRLFEADRDVVVRLAPDAYRKLPPPVEEPMLPLPAPEGGVLPAPRKVEDEKKEDSSELPVLPPSPTADPGRPLKGAVELLKPVYREEE